MFALSFRTSSIAIMIGAALFALSFIDVSAQQTGIIRGTVVDAAGNAVQGAQIVISDLQRGTLSDESGAYQFLEVPAGSHTMQVYRLGYTSESRSIEVPPDGVVEVNFVMRQTAIALEGLVVTALGISREERSLGYAVQELSGNDLELAGEVNFIESLTGQAAGVQVTNSGPMGGSNRIVIRGASSFSGDNQPLVIVDGVPIHNSRPMTGTGSAPGGGMDYGSAIQDINPANIESVSILKGANAAALYGARAADGVIVITTKSGTGLEELSVEASTKIQVSTPLRLPAYQNRYGGGSTPSGYNWVDGRGGGVNDGIDESWGPALDGQMFPQWWSNGLPVPWVPHPYNVRQYYNMGISTTTNFAVAAGGEVAHVRASLLRMDAQGLTPAHTLERTQVSVNGGLDIGDGLNVNSSVRYSKNVGHNRPQWLNGSLNAMHIILWFQRQVNMGRLKRAYENWDPSSGVLTPNWNHNYHDNVYWLAKAKTNTDTRDHITGQVTLNYRFTPSVTFEIQGGSDIVSWRMNEHYPALSQDFPEGGFNRTAIYRQEVNIDALATAERAVAEDVHLGVSLGATWRRNTTHRRSASSERLKVPGIYNPANSVAPADVRYFRSEQEVQSLYGLISAAYRNYLFLDVTGRNDWSSTLPVGNHSYFYPSVSTSIILTDAFGLNMDFLPYAKIRASWARVGSDAQPYQLASVYQGTTPFGGVPGFTSSDQIPNRNLKPEVTDSWEVGTNLRFASGRAFLDLTYYNATTKNQILAVPVSDASGFGTQVLNAGSIANRGIEALFNIRVLTLDNGFSWNITTNFAKNSSEVVSLYPGIESLVLGSGLALCCGITVEARPGEEYGAIVGTAWQYNEQGQLMLNAQGIPIRVSDRVVLGHFQPDWLASLRSTFHYKGLDVSLLIDHRHGGEIFCGTCELGRETGVLKETAFYGSGDLERRENGIAYEGVLPDGSQNDIKLSARLYADQLEDAGFRNVYENTWTKLREIRVGFEVPASLVGLLPVSGARVTLFGRNLWLWTDIPHIDPETARSNGNYQGVEMEQYPSARTFGINISVRR